MAHALLARLWQLYRPVVHDAAAMHECNAVAQIDGLVDVVGDKQHRRAMPMAGAQQIVLQLGARDGIQRRKRLVEQQQRRLQNQGSRQRHATLLSARELARVKPCMGGKTQLLQQLHGRLLILLRGFALQRHGQQHVVDHRMPVQQCRCLEHEAQLRPRRCQFAAAQQDMPRLRPEQACRQLEQRGLAAAAAPQQAVKLSGPDLPVHAIHHGRSSRVAESGLLELHECHGCIHSLSPHKRPAAGPPVLPTARSPSCAPDPAG
jgi:hypothetical protein